MTSYYTQWCWITARSCKCNRICGFTKMISWWKAEPFRAQLNVHYIMASSVSSPTGWLHPAPERRGFNVYAVRLCAPSFLSKCPSRILNQVTGIHCGALFSWTAKHKKTLITKYGMKRTICRILSSGWLKLNRLVGLILPWRLRENALVALEIVPEMHGILWHLSDEWVKLETKMSRLCQALHANNITV